jgi:hypothetical protein
VSEEELDLIQFAASEIAEARARPSQVVRRELIDARGGQAAETQASTIVRSTGIHRTVLSLRRSRHATYDADDLIAKSETVFPYSRRHVDDGAPRMRVDRAAGAARFLTAVSGGHSCDC